MSQETESVCVSHLHITSVVLGVCYKIRHRTTTVVIVLGDLEGTKKQQEAKDPRDKKENWGAGWKEITEQVSPRMEAPPKQALRGRGTQGMFAR